MGKGAGGTARKKQALLHSALVLAQVAQVVQQQQLRWVLLGLGVVHLEEAKEAERRVLEQLETALAIVVKALVRPCAASAPMLGWFPIAKALSIFQHLECLSNQSC